MKSWPAQKATEAAVPFQPDRSSTASAGKVRGKRGRLERLREMGLVEVTYRGRQEARKLIERFSQPRDYHHPERLLRDQAPALATPQAALHFVRALGPARFFAGVGDPAIVLTLRDRMPDDYRRLLTAAADAVIGRHIDLLGYRAVPLGDGIEWHREPVSGRRSPMVHWSLVRTLDPSSVGDSKIIW
jgi:hypothetical protein